MCSSNVERAICSAVDNIGMIESGRRLSLVKERGCATFRSDFEGTVHSDPHELFEATPLIMKKILGWASEEIPVEVHLPFAQPQDTSEFERLLGPDLVFNTDAPALVFDSDALTLPLRVPELTGNRRRPMDPASIVRKAVRNMQDILDLKRPSAIDVADSLGITLRTMQRKLKLWGTTYEELLAEFLMLHAAHDLRLSGHSVTDVAFNLGYSDSGHFARAFKRWTGYTPRDFQASELIPLSPLQSIVLEQGIATQQLH
jgi:AraC-like DNA-binding protein